ncbi:reverse transcriptase domain-containing protein [Tanacetum coccineum]
MVGDVPEADVPPQKRLCLTAPTPRFEVRKSSAAAAARQPGLDVTHATNYSFVDTMDADQPKQMMYAPGAWADSEDKSAAIEAHTLEAREPARTDDPKDVDSIGNQVKYATCTLLGNALMWWNSHVKTVGHGTAYGIPWKTLMKMMTDKYCLRGEIKKLEIEIWNLKVKGTDVESYTQHFQELALLCGRMFSKVSNMVEKYAGKRPDMIQGSVMASKPNTIQDAIEFAIKLMD